MRRDAAIELTKEQIEGVHVEYIEISELPMLNTDLEVEGALYPPQVEAFRQKVLEADSCLFASPDYNYSITRTYASFLFNRLFNYQVPSENSCLCNLIYIMSIIISAISVTIF